MQYLFVVALLGTLGTFFSRNARRRYHHHPNVTDALDDLDDYDLDFRPPQYPASYQQPPQQALNQSPFQVAGPTQPPLQHPSAGVSESGTLMSIMMVLLIAVVLGLLWILNTQKQGAGQSLLSRLIPPPPQQETMQASVVQSNYSRVYLKPLLSDVYVIYLQEYASKEGVDLLARTLPVPNKIRSVQKGGAYWACIFLPSEDDAPLLLKNLDKYRKYGIDPKLINLKNNCAGFEFGKAVCKCGETVD
jgi:hypothetical protein